MSLQRLGYSVALTAALVTLLGGCWLAPGGGPNRSGHNAVEDEIAVDTVHSLTEVWSTDGGSTSPVVIGSRVYLADSNVRAHDVTTGAPVWSNPENPVGDAWGVFIDGTELLVAGGSDRLGWTTTRIDRHSGQALGQAPAVGRLGSVRGTTHAGDTRPSPFDPVLVHRVTVADPVVADRNWQAVLLVGEQPSSPRPPTLAVNHVVVAGQGLLSTDPTDPSTGTSVRGYALAGQHAACATVGDAPFEVTYTCPTWSTPVDGTTTTAPVLSDDLQTVFVGTDAGTVHALDVATGVVHWTVTVGSAVTHEPAVAEGVLLVPTASNGLAAIPAGGCGTPACSPAWTADTEAAIVQQPVVAGGVVFTGSEGGSLDAFAIEGCGSATCSPLWSADLAGEVNAPVAVASGHLFVTIDGALHVYAPA